MAEVGAVGSVGSTSVNVQNTQDTKNTAALFSMLLSNMLSESMSSIADFSNTDGGSGGSLFGDSGMTGSSGTMNTMLMMMLLSKQGNGNAANADLLMEMMGMGSSSSALSALGATGGNTGGFSAIPTMNSANVLSTYLNQYKSANTLGTIPAAAWIQANPSVTNNIGERSASAYRSVINQFNVENNPRYTVNKLGQGDTYCNIFAWDVSRAMGAEIPHYINATTGEPAQAGGSGVQELDANAVNDWLNTYGRQYGWVPVNAQQAQNYANQGMPAVTSWKNTSGGHGHMQVVSPSADGSYNAARGVAIAQAGAHLYNYNYITSVYGPDSLNNVQYFVHI